eukprot:CAMPEP_0117610344 /NCGR_PEP_ID=MMETSP0784-20121206/81824_1 /TAXON_ID=39447 /ORGANISM="" /LENGTH=60 /DNA_ID=CAMNT_0005413743 /DNA_START=15 /DNA_END=197 /DNA_ORIENTATION=-
MAVRKDLLSCRRNPMAATAPANAPPTAAAGTRLRTIQPSADAMCFGRSALTSLEQPATAR